MGTCTSAPRIGDEHEYLADSDADEDDCSADSDASLFSLARRPFDCMTHHCVDAEYAIDRGHVLGSGGYATVHRAVERTTQKVVAVKRVSKFRNILDSDAVKREISLMEALCHANVIQFQDMLEDVLAMHIVTELCEGGDLLIRLNRDGRFTSSQARCVMEQILESIRYIHSQGVCHRDVKLDNFVFLTADVVENNILKLIDFGLATRFNDATRLTGKVGTPDYAAPEVYLDSYGSEVDEWSCGVVLYAMLCGRMPFIGRTSQAVMSKVRSGQPNYRHPIWNSVPTGAQQLVQSLLTKKVKKRCNACDALGHAWIRNAGVSKNSRV